MKKIKYILITSILIFLLNFPAHFIFNWCKNPFISYLFPTNESIFQHLKMIFTCYFIFYLILCLFNKKLKYNNIFFANLISSLCCIFFFLIIYLPCYIIFGENLIFTIILLFFSIMLGQFVSGFIIYKKLNQYINLIALLVIILILIINSYLTYHPILKMLFYDPLNKTYNIVYKN